ncbi:MAG: hypothetical protein D6723_07595 [Acidobacteria bacterium]|nr:MAG: hypothetical protein D6723_07595 [Acidobacteriota bacterium]
MHFFFVPHPKLSLDREEVEKIKDAMVELEQQFNPHSTITAQVTGDEHQNAYKIIIRIEGEGKVLQRDISIVGCNVVVGDRKVISDSGGRSRNAPSAKREKDRS